MLKKNSAFPRKCMAVLLVLSSFFAIPMAVGAEDITEDTPTPYASYYLSRYGASVTGSGNSVSVNLDVTGTGIMDWVGASSVYLYESTGGSFNLVRIFTNATDGGRLLSQNNYYHVVALPYNNGIRGAYYYAVVNFYAEKNSGSDTRAYTTTTIRL